MELGAYAVSDLGQGCKRLLRDLAAVHQAHECCLPGDAHSRSRPQNGTAVNGTVDFDMSGGFASGMVSFGSAQRSGCVGTWNAVRCRHLPGREIALDGTNMWVTNLGSDNVTKLSPSGATLGTFAVGNSPEGIAFDGAHMWVTNVTPTGNVTEL
jgi:hypothetical protein